LRKQRDAGARLKLSPFFYVCLFALPFSGRATEYASCESSARPMVAGTA